MNRLIKIVALATLLVTGIAALPADEAKAWGWWPFSSGWGPWGDDYYYRRPWGWGGYPGYGYGYPGYGWGGYPGYGYGYPAYGYGYPGYGWGTYPYGYAQPQAQPQASTGSSSSAQ